MIDPDPIALAAAEASFRERVDGRLPDECFAFGGDQPEIVDRIAGYLTRGTKRATFGLVVDYEHAGESLPEPGHRSFVHDRSGRPYAALEVTHVEVAPIDAVTPVFAWDEGEGDRTVEFWRRGHERYFRTFLPTIGVEFSWELLGAFENFRVIWPELDPAEPPVLTAADGCVVRELRREERSVACAATPEVMGLPLLGAFADGERVGLLAFRPRGEALEVAAVTSDDEGVAALLHRGHATLEERHRALVR